jgi:hypothetical protein
MTDQQLLEKSFETILYFCRRCEEQGFYSPPRQAHVIETLNLLTKRLSREQEEPILEGLYDNMQTYQRENYHNGELLSWVSASMTGNSTYLLGYEWDAPWGTYPDIPKGVLRT